MKTASTYLQANVFSNPAGGFAVPLSGAGRAFLVEQIILSDGFSFHGETVRGKFEEAAQTVTDRGLIPVWSDEGLLGDPVARRYDAYSNAIRVKEALPDAHVLITIREQTAMALSMYVEYIHQAGLADLTQFIGTGNELLSFSPFLRSDFLMFDRAVKYYQSLFGEDRVLVLPQELLALDRAAYFQLLSDFTGKEIDLTSVSSKRVHKSMGATANQMRRIVNRLKTPRVLSSSPSTWEKGLEKGLRMIDRSIPSSIDNLVLRPITRQIEDRYRGQFVDSNRRLSEMTGLDLQQLGYE